MSEAQQEEPAPSSGNAYFATLERIVDKLTGLNCIVADPNGIALSQGGELDSRKPWCWILAETRASQPPPSGRLSGFYLMVMPAPRRRRQRIAKIFIRNETHAVVDFRSSSMMNVLNYALGVVTHELDFTFHHNMVEEAPLFEAFPNDPPPSPR